MDQNHAVHVEPLETPREYAKLAAVLAGITLLSVLLTSWRSWELHVFLHDFMAIFFVTFAAFKLIDVEAFAVIYRRYDIVTQRFPVWGYLFPFVEASLGFAYLLTNRNNLLYLITLLIIGTSSIGVVQSLSRKSRIRCACLGGVIRLPLSKVSLVEDGLMFAMALVMVIR